MNDHIDIHEAARRLGISVRTARCWSKDGSLPARLWPSRYGPAYFIPVAAIDAIIAQRPARAPEAPAAADVLALQRAVADLHAEVRRMRTEIVALRELLPSSQGDEQCPDELVGPRQRRDERQAEEERRAEDIP